MDQIMNTPGYTGMEDLFIAAVEGNVVSSGKDGATTGSV
jgi:hypothetical protein